MCKLGEPWSVYRIKFPSEAAAKAFRQAYYHQARRGRVPKTKIRVAKDVVTLVKENPDV